MTTIEQPDRDRAGSTQGVGRTFLDAARRQLAERADRIAHCLGQLDDAQVWWRPQESMNSIANLLLHLGGNLRQWIVSGVGGEPDRRDRPGEFSERGSIPRVELLDEFRVVVARVDAVLANLDEGRLLEPRRIQGFDETVLSATWHSLEHLGGHTQEIIHLTRLQLGDRYRFAWTPSTPEQGGASPGSQAVFRATEGVGLSATAVGPGRSEVGVIDRGVDFRHRGFHGELATWIGKLPTPDGKHFVLAYEHGSLSVELYAPRGIDAQAPHGRDEVYVVVRGEGWFVNGPNRHRFGPGDLLFVPAGIEHRFEDFSDDLAVWVVFYGPLGGERARPDA